MKKTVQWWVIGFLLAFGIAFGMGIWGSSLGISFGLGPWVLGMSAGVFLTWAGCDLAGKRRMALASDETYKEGLSLRPRPGHALLVIYRAGLVGMVAGMNVALDGRRAARLKSPRFTLLNIGPGHHTIAFSFDGRAGAQINQAEVTLDAEEGAVIALQATVVMGAIKKAIIIDWIKACPSDLRARLAGMKRAVAEVAG